MRCVCPSAQRGFTLIEALVVTGIVATLVALLVPAVQRVRQAAARTQTLSNFQQVGLAIHAAHDVKKKLPPVYSRNNDAAFPGVGTMFFHLLPYVEQTPLFRLGKEGRNSFANAVHHTVVAVYLSPEDYGGLIAPGEWAASNIAANYQVFGASAFLSPYRLHTISDGVSNVPFLTTRLGVCTPGPSSGNLWAHGSWNWAYMPMFAYASTSPPQVRPTPWECDPARAHALSADGIVLGMGDGSARLSTLSDRAAWWKACAPNDDQTGAALFD